MKVNGNTLQVSETLGEKINNAVVASGAGLVGGMVAAGVPVAASLFTTGYLWTPAGAAVGMAALPAIVATAGGVIVHELMAEHEQAKARAVIEKASSLDVDLRDTKMGVRITSNVFGHTKIVSATDPAYKDIPEATVGEYLKATNGEMFSYSVTREAKRVQTDFITDLRSEKKAEVDVSAVRSNNEGLASRMMAILRDPAKQVRSAPKPR